MKILVIGGTGLVGSYLLPKLAAKQHTVYALTRDSNKVDRIRQLGAVGVIGDIRQPETFVTNLPDKPEIIVLLAMPSVTPGKRVTRKRKAELKNETNDFFRNTLDLAIKFGIPAILPGGTSYKTTNNEIADETWPVYRKGVIEIGADTDVMVAEAFKTGRPQVVQLMYGKIYGNGGMFRKMYEMMEKGSMKVIGGGQNCIPNIYAGDAASAIVLAIEKLPVGERFIIADDTPVTQAEFTCRMAELMGKKKPGKIPGCIVKLVIGKDLFAVISMDCKVSNEKVKRILGWEPEYPSSFEGMKTVIEEMRNSKPYFS